MKLISATKMTAIVVSCGWQDSHGSAHDTNAFLASSLPIQWLWAIICLGRVFSQRGGTMFRKQEMSILVGILASLSIWSSVHAAGMVMSGMSMTSMKEYVTGKKTRKLFDVQFILPRAVMDRCDDKDPASRCTQADKDAKKAFWDLHGDCRFKSSAEKYCVQIAENAELDGDFSTAALYRQHACNLGDGKSCKLALKDLDKLGASAPGGAPGSTTVAAVPAGTPAAAGAGAAAQPLASDSARSALLAAVTGKRSAMPMDVSKVIPRRETRIALDCESRSGSACSSNDMERLKFFMNLQDECINGVHVFDHVETKDRPKYCAIIAEGAESNKDFESAAIYRQRACDLGQGKSCKLALKNLEAARSSR